jgi:hypothetical protein
MSRKMRWSRYAACMQEMRNAYVSFIRKPERKRLGRPRHMRTTL